METIQVLDCTLRDGGYCNEWRFGKDNIRKIVTGLVEADIDIIECGFLTNRVKYDKDVTKFTSIQEMANFIPHNRDRKLFVCMMNYGEYHLGDIPEYDGTSVDGIRVAFHKKDLLSALEFSKGIIKKGYKVFIQAMVSLSYTDEEFLDLIYRCNQLSPYAFYIVDSFGVMKRKDLKRLFYMVEHNLKESIIIGYHSHNNMQLAYANAQTLVDIPTKRDFIIDSSIFGMGRGAGNLNTELFVEYLNDTIGTKYLLKPLLAIIDEILNHFYQCNYWGYSLPNYLSAAYNAHPAYAGYLDDKKTLTIENMEEIFSIMEEDRKNSYDKEYMEQLYIQYLAAGQVHEMHTNELKEKLQGKKVLLIAPGKSAEDEKNNIIAFAEREDVISIGINFNYSAYNTDYIFVSNLRRFRDLNETCKGKCIVTSNIPAAGIYIQTKYKDLINKVEAVKDNAGMMLIQFLINLDVKELYIAGLDGYGIDTTQNFADARMNFVMRKEVLEARNKGLETVLTEYSRKIRIEFLTKPKFLVINKR